MGKKQTFIVEIQDTQHDSWQGSIEWVQGQKKQAFRSTMELLRLIDSSHATKMKTGRKNRRKETLSCK